MRTTTKAGACLSAALVALGCQTRDIHAPLPAGSPGGSLSQAIARAKATKSPQLVYSDDFERAELGQDWRRGTGEKGSGSWRIVDGALEGDTLKNDPLWWTKPLPEGPVRVEFDAVAKSAIGDLKAEIFGDGQRHASGYVLIQGGWSNSLDVVARLDEHGDDRMVRRSAKVKLGKTYRWRIERGGDGAIVWYIDNKLFMRYPDASPLTGPSHRFFAFGDWTAPVRFDNYKVYVLPPG